MHSRQKTFSPLFRCFAAGALLGWVAAQVLCFAHCNFGTAHGDSEETSCHGTAPITSHHDEGDSSGQNHHESSPSTACSTLKSALIGSSATTPVLPDFQLLYTLTPLALALDLTAEPTVSNSRQAKLRDWVFTPEVCLGPAFRALAPPALS